MKKVEILPAKPKEIDTEKDERDLELDQDEPVELDLEEEAEPTEEDSEILPVALPPVETLASSDPLKRYLQEIRHAPELTQEQEVYFAKRMAEANDLHAAKTLVSANLKLVVRIAYEYRSMYHNLLDLIQEGNVGLMKAVSKFDPTKGVRLGYYATWWIRSYILKYLLDNFRLVRVGTSTAQKRLFYHLMREKQRLEAQGITAAPALIAQNLNVKEKDVIEMEQRLLSPGSEMSVDAPLSQDSDRPSSLAQILQDPGIRADEKLDHEEQIQILKEILPKLQASLNEKEKNVLNARILSEDPKTLQEVADDYGLTRERVRQIEAKVIQKIKALFLEKTGQ